MNTAATDFGGKIISQPESVVQAEICRVSGQRATPYCYDTFTDPATGATLTGPSKIQEYFRKGSENLPFCPLHSGATSGAPAAASGNLILTAVIDTTPVRSKAPVLLGEDPYYTEQMVLEGASQPSPRNRTNVLDSFDLGDGEAKMKLPWPDRLKISPE
jgi:penicillin-binding protein 1A